MKVGGGGEFFHKGICWIPGRSSSLSLWHDNWLPHGSLRLTIQGPLNAIDESLRVKDCLWYKWVGLVKFIFSHS